MTLPDIIIAINTDREHASNTTGLSERS
jgi:hypothetical protein